MSFISRKRVAALATIPFALLLSACHVHNGVVVNSPDDVDLVFTFDTEDSSIAPGANCDLLKTTVEPLKDLYGPATINPLEGAKGLGCVVKFDMSGIMVNALYTHSGDVHTINMPKTMWDQFNASFDSAAGGAQMPDYTLTFSMTFPVDVTEASNGGVIDGHTVTWTDKDQIMAGITATAKEGGAASEPSKSETEEPTSKPETTKKSTSTPTGDYVPLDEREENKNGFPVWGWAAIAGVAAAGIGGVLYSMNRKKKTDQPAAFPQGYDPNFAAQAYGQDPNTPVAPSAPISNQFGQPFHQAVPQVPPTEQMPPATDGQTPQN